MAGDLGPRRPQPDLEEGARALRRRHAGRAFAPLFGARHPDDLAKRTVELALAVAGLVRAGLYFYDDRLELMLGTWGTDLRRKVVDEHTAMFRVDAPGRSAFARAISGEALWTVVEDCPIIVNAENSTRAGRSNMLEAARAAGFGSYAQFHRVFQTLRGTTPRAYLGRRAARTSPRKRA